MCVCVCVCVCVKLRWAKGRFVLRLYVCVCGGGLLLVHDFMTSGFLGLVYFSTFGFYRMPFF